MKDKAFDMPLESHCAICVEQTNHLIRSILQLADSTRMTKEVILNGMSGVIAATLKQYPDQQREEVTGRVVKAIAAGIRDATPEEIAADQARFATPH